MESAQAGESAPNHPSAPWMALIGATSHNMVVGTIMGSFSVLIAASASRTGLSLEKVQLAGPLVMLGSAISAPFVGDLIARKSIKLMMGVGTLMALAGFVLLAFVPSAPVYYAVYLLLFGPAMAVSGSVGPATLVTRWFNRNRGLALGLVHINLIMVVMPLLCVWLLGAYGALAVYLMMTFLLGAILFPAVMAVRDFPPGVGEPDNSTLRPAEAADTLTLGQIARQPVFWFIAATASAIITGIMVLTFSMVPLAASLGFSAKQGALLLSVMSFSGMAGSILFGWVADRLGGFRGLALLAFNYAALMALTVTGLPYPALVVVIGLLGLHGGGMVPNVSRALAVSLGQGSFSRAFGLSSFLSVPFTGLGIAGMAQSHRLTGSYNTALLAVAALLIAAVPLTLLAAKTKVRPA